MATGGVDLVEVEDWRTTNQDFHYDKWRKCNVCDHGYKAPVALPCLHTACYNCLLRHIHVQRIQYDLIYQEPLDLSTASPPSSSDEFEGRADNDQSQGASSQSEGNGERNNEGNRGQDGGIDTRGRLPEEQEQYDDRAIEGSSDPTFVTRGKETSEGQGLERVEEGGSSGGRSNEGSGGSEADRESVSGRSAGSKGRGCAVGSGSDTVGSSGGSGDDFVRVGRGDNVATSGSEGDKGTGEEKSYGLSASDGNVNRGNEEEELQGAVGGVEEKSLSQRVMELHGVRQGPNPLSPETDDSPGSDSEVWGKPKKPSSRESPDSDPTDPEEKYVTSDDPTVRKTLKDRKSRRLKTACIFREHLAHVTRHVPYDRVEALTNDDSYPPGIQAAQLLHQYDLGFGHGELEVIHPIAIGLNPRTGHLVVADSTLSKAVMFSKPNCPVGAKRIDNPVSVCCFMKQSDHYREERFCFGGHSRTSHEIKLFCVPFKSPSQMTVISQPMRDISGLLMRGPLNRLVMCLPHTNDVFAETNDGRHRIIASGKSQGLFNPTHIIEGHDEFELLLADTNNHRIVKLFGPDFMAYSTYGRFGSLPGQFFYPLGLALDSKKRLFVCDANNYRVQVLDKDFEFESAPIIHTFNLGRSVTQDVKPVDCAVDSRDRLTVLFTGREFAAIQVYRYLQPLHVITQGDNLIVVEPSCCEENCTSCYLCCRRCCCCCDSDDEVSGGARRREDYERLA
ncbi:uncharacterized protein LOC101857287 isoform X2 [Aplysia californica]|uniref:Uncharacterized protein LOC101857287 isoform X2 n=1 Tax=Aplysia californica TaxID=6500 RepID=A0ABM1W2H1_APLCA|nr:uncharacterized protein LOC101857287 isoform X2 [Aplysia californica]